MMALSEVATVVHGTFGGVDMQFASVTTDSRLVADGDLFVAIPGERHDGHQFIDQAKSNGAAAAMVSRTVNVDVAQIKVSDTTIAMGELASYWRSRFDIPILAITGSNGKTTITSMAASILSQSGKCLAPEKSFNNQWGVPLTLLRLTAHHNFAVIEMGTNHAGEIAYLSELTRPNIALISNISAAHLEGLGSLEEVALAKAEIYLGLSESDVAVINLDDQFGQQFLKSAKSQLTNGRVVSYSAKSSADIRAADIRLLSFSSEFDLIFVDQCIRIKLPIPGRHNVQNALAAAAMCFVAGVSLETIKTGLESVRSVPGRLNIKQGLCGSTVLDDSYNANPQSLKAGLDVLATSTGTTIAVLGAMAELGESSKELHCQVGVYAKRKGIQYLYCLAEGDNSDAHAYAEGFGDASHVYDNLNQLVTDLKTQQLAGVTILIKGSRASAMERVVRQISVDSKIVADSPIEGEFNYSEETGKC